MKLSPEERQFIIEILKLLKALKRRLEKVLDMAE